MKCGHDDCFSCPFPDCILSSTPRSGRERRPDYEKKHAYYLAHREVIKARALAYYHKKKDGELQQQLTAGDENDQTSKKGGPRG